MIILCDVDGVVADMLPAWLTLYNREYDDHLTPESITEWELLPFVKSECGKKVYQYLHDPKLYNMTHEVPGALRSLALLRNHGHRVVYLTHCVGPEMVHAKWQWLQSRGFLTHGELIALGSMKGKELVHGDVMIDDYDQNLLHFPGVRLLFDAPYNRESPVGFRVRSWEEIIYDLLGA